MTDLNISVKADLIDKIKSEAYRRIIAVLPEWKQRNLTARGLQLVNKSRATTLTAEEEAEAAAIDDIWTSTVVPIRSHSDYLEAEVIAGRAVDIYSGWPV